MFQTSGRTLQTSGRTFEKSGLENYYQLSWRIPCLKGKPTEHSKGQGITCFDSTLLRLCLHFALSNRMYEIDERYSKSMSPTQGEGDHAK